MHALEMLLLLLSTWGMWGVGEIDERSSRQCAETHGVPLGQSHN